MRRRACGPSGRALTNASRHSLLAGRIEVGQTGMRKAPTIPTFPLERGKETSPDPTQKQIRQQRTRRVDRIAGQVGDACLGQHLIVDQEPAMEAGRRAHQHRMRGVGHDLGPAALRDIDAGDHVGAEHLPVGGNAANRDAAEVNAVITTLAPYQPRALRLAELTRIAGWTSAPEYDADHPEEFSYRAFPVGPLLTAEASIDDPILQQIVHPDLDAARAMLDPLEDDQVLTRFRPGIPTCAGRT